MNKELIENKDYSQIITTGQTKLEDFIGVFNNVMSDTVCDLILNEYESSDEWQNTKIEGAKVDKSVKNCMNIGISQYNTIQKNREIRKKIDKLIHNSIGEVIYLYKKIFPAFNIEIDTGYELLRYNEGEFYIQHTDSFKDQQRSLACSIQLNDDYDGGEFGFFNRDVIIRSQKGSVTVFPSNFMYPHEIMPVIRGTRYAIITWLI